MAKKSNTNRNFGKTLNQGIEQVKEAAINANDFVYETTEGVVDTVVKRGEEWQKVTEKAINGGLKLASNQQDIIFDALEVVKGQFVAGRKRFKTLFSKN